MDRDIILIEVARRGRDSVPAPPDWSAIRADVIEVKGRPAINALTDVPDVSGTPQDGSIVAYDASAGVWLVQAPQPALTVQDTGSVDLTFASGTLSAEVRYAGSGTTDSAARSDHRHNPVALARGVIEPGGYMSSGTRSLGSVSFVGDVGVVYHVIARLRQQMRGADPGPCHYRQALTVAGNTRTSPAGQQGFWCVQGVPDRAEWVHGARITSTGQSITVSATVAHGGGGGFYTDYGELEVEIYPSS